MAGFYSSAEWGRIRTRQLARAPMCEGCERAPAREVDHVKPISDGGSRRDASNLQSLCKGCHSAKTNAQRRGLAWVPEKHRGCDVNGYPLDPAHPWSAAHQSEAPSRGAFDRGNVESSERRGYPGGS